MRPKIISNLLQQTYYHVFTLIFLVCFFSMIPTIAAHLIETNSNFESTLNCSKQVKITPVTDLQLPSPLWRITVSNILQWEQKHHNDRAQEIVKTPNQYQWDSEEFPLSFAAQDCHSIAA